ncbi:MAG: glycosyltransferase [Desulfosarcina sp.]|nr:glycosyltransferase [Desulfosarcina sp.]MBC2742547.1 glycosyltransferase [Desulfosarcina sp.]MBC2765457.1 glycosyltransferase [Desulfosarcina sp.]
MTRTELKQIWARIDRAYCISLDDRKDRQASAQDQFARVGLNGRVAFFIAQRHPSDCEQGIVESHQTCLKMGLEAGARHILVFEDDVMFGKINARRLAESLDFFMNADDRPILFLGCLSSGSRTTETPGIRGIQYRCLTHAYLVKRSIARQVVDTPWKGVPFDVMLRNCASNPVALYPSIAYQSNSMSDNSRHQALDIIRRLFGGLRFIQIVNERYHRFRYAVIAAHLLVIGAVILWILT